MNEGAKNPGELDDFRKRLDALLNDAREAGLFGELRSLLAELLEAQDHESPNGGESQAARAPKLPRRFGMIGDSTKMKRVFDLIERVAPSDVSVLIHGETGTGKELCARAMHDNSKRKKKTFVAENCAAVPATLLESELFGHKKGSFTGAVADRDGHFVVADGGTVFLDEIGDMPLEMQAKLLRVLQEGEVRPVGANKTRKVDVRVVAATNKDLEAMCREGTFREDLFFRLNVVTILLPPLREREGDVEHLVAFYAHAIGKELGRTVRVTPPALKALSSWSWPGNVRELENELKRAAVLSDGTIGPEALSPQIAQA